MLFFPMFVVILAVLGLLPGHLKADAPGRHVVVLLLNLVVINVIRLREPASLGVCGR